MQIIFHSQFKKTFKKLPKNIQARFYERFEIFNKDKFNVTLNNHSVGKAYPGCRSINITGDYRAIYEEANEVIVFMIIGTHSELY